MLNELLKKQRDSVAHFFESIDLSPVEALIENLSQTRGVLFLTGVGKSGLVAKKIAFTMVSTGTKAFYMSPIDALHGDLGVVSPDDLFLFFSKSGESDELLALLPAVKNKGAKVVAVTCRTPSRLGRMADKEILLPMKEELCPFDMAPTTSTSIQLLFGDLLAVALMRRKGFSLDAYALNHPSGRIGKRITLKVTDVMLSGDRLPLCTEETPLEEALVELTNKRCGCLLIVDRAGKLKGLFTDGDLRRTLQQKGENIFTLKMGEVMQKDPSTISPQKLAREALDKMEGDPTRRFMMLPVTDESGVLVGLVHLHDIIQRGV